MTWREALGYTIIGNYSDTILCQKTLQRGITGDTGDHLTVWDTYAIVDLPRMLLDSEIKAPLFMMTPQGEARLPSGRPSDLAEFFRTGRLPVPEKGVFDHEQ